MYADSSAKSGVGVGGVASGGVVAGVVGTVLNSYLDASAYTWKSTAVQCMPLVSAMIGVVGMVVSWYAAEQYKRWQRKVKHAGLETDAAMMINKALSVRNDPASNDAVKQMAEATIQNAQLTKLAAMNAHMQESAQSAGVVNSGLPKAAADAPQQHPPQRPLGE